MASRFPYVVLLIVFACNGSAKEVEEAAPAEAEPTGTFSQLTTQPEVLLTDVTEDWNVRFTHESGAQGELLFPEMMGSGVAVLDVDQDADLDLYFVTGARHSNPSGSVNRLFVQDGLGRFRDATEGSGLGDTGYGTGVAVGDVDNDGFEDVYVANIGPDRLFRGLGNGRFQDVTSLAGLTGEASTADWSSSAAFCDIDRDGFLDLYVVRYVVFDPDLRCTDKAGRREYCGPDSFEDRADLLWINRGDGSFRNVTTTAGIDLVTGAGLGVVCEDLDGDGWVDIYVANDGDPNQLWINQGDGTFIDDALIMGTSVNAAGNHEAGMGVVSADFDNDLDFDLFLTHLRGETNTFYRNLGGGKGFEDQTTQMGLAGSSVPFTGFGTAAFDIDLDGDLDLAVVNGRVLRGNPLTAALDKAWNPYAEPNLVYLNVAGTFRLAGTEVAAFTEPVEVGRGLASGDLDSDGDLDLVLSNLASPARIYRTESPQRHWLHVDTFDPRLNRRALGSQVTVTSSTNRQMRTVQSAMSYLSSSDPRAHFGLGNSNEKVTVSVLWPDGLEESFGLVAVDQAIVLRRGEGSQ